jgi:hypothetical protein
MRRLLPACSLAPLLLPLLSLAQDPGATTPAQPPAETTGASPFARLLLIPDISAIASFAAAWNDYDVELLSPREGPFAPRESEPAFLFEEVELAIQAVIDPYARADIFTALGPEGVEVEEAFLTTLSLPAGLQVKAGRFRSPFGRQNQQHPHSLDFVDAPLALGRLLAPEALSGDGVQAAWLAPTPWFAELILAAQSVAVEEDGEDRMTGTARLLQYVTIGDATTVGVGLSGAIRAEGAGEHRDLIGADVYVRIRPPTTRAYLALTGEVFARRLGTALSEADWGAYAQAFWRQGPRWGFGARWDSSPTALESAAEPGREHRVSALAAWLPSEFQRIRLQLSYDRLPGGDGGIEALAGLEFSIGAHGAHPF